MLYEHQHVSFSCFKSLTSRRRQRLFFFLRFHRFELSNVFYFQKRRACRRPATLQIYRAVLILYCGQRLGGDKVAPNTNLNIAHNQVTNRTRHETPDLFDRASRDGPRSVRNTKNHVEFKSREQVSREAGFSKPVAVGHCFVTRPVILLTDLGTAAPCRQFSPCVMTLQQKQKV